MRRNRHLVPLAILSTGLSAACTWIHPTEPLRDVPASTPIPTFEEVPVDFAHRWDRALAHHLTGASVLDVDGDGKSELFVGGGEGQPDALLSLEDGRLVDRIEGTGLSSTVATYGSLAIDLDGDGDVDLAVARNDGVTLYRRDGDRFTPVRLEVELPEHSVVLAIAAGDIERDGDADLYLSVFVDFPHFVPATFNVPDHAKGNRLLRNDGGLRFTDVTTPVTASKQNTFTSAFVDLDDDGLQDLVIAQNTGRVEILRNAGGSAFEAIDAPTGYGFWMGVAVGDYDADGDQDLLFTNVGDSFPGFVAHGDLHDDQPYAGGWALLRNEGGLRLRDVTAEADLAGLGFAWGALFEDVNLDGRLDLLASQNYVKWPVHRLFKFPGKVLLGIDGGRFAPAAVAENESFSNAPLLADLDGDGRPDLFWLNNDGPSRAYLNRSAGHAVMVELPDDAGSLGARVRLERTDSGDGAAPHAVREVVSGAGLGIDPAPRVVFGLGAATRADRLVVEWPDGRTTAIHDPAVDRVIRVGATSVTMTQPSQGLR